jgi:outer membrane biosynthesis protein TonB
MSRRPSAPDRAPFIGSAVLHVAILALIAVSSAFKPEPMIFETIAIDLVSPPPTVEAPDPTPAEQQLVVEAPPEAQPDPTPPAPQPEKRPEPEPERQPERRPTPPAPQPTPPEPDPQRQPARGPDADRSSPGGENINVRMEGLRRDFPEYYNNIVLQIKRCFRPPKEGRWQTTVMFVIRRDGVVQSDDIDVTKGSGNVGFDFQAMGAVECAGERFGPLPADLPLDRLPVQFTFTPAGAGGP